MRNYTKKVKVIKPISHIIADSNYSVFHYTDGTKKMFATTLKKLESEGLRIHKSVIVNPGEIMKVLTGEVQMKDGSVFPVARRRVNVLNEIQNLNRLTII